MGATICSGSSAPAASSSMRRSTASIVSRRLAISSAASRRRSSRPWTASPSQRITRGSARPWPIRVTTITAKLRNRIRSRCGNGSPLAVVSGIASAAASDTMPRMPVKPIRNGACQGGDGSRRASDGREPARQIGRREDPDEARDDHDGADERRRADQLAGLQVADAVDQRARLQTRQQEDHALDQVREQAPEEHALQPRRRGDQHAGRSSSCRARRRPSRARPSRPRCSGTQYAM